jgi:hypothetical protein
VLNCVNELISSQQIASWDRALGLYVVCRSHAEYQQLRNAIIAERHADRLRVASVDAVLSLAELVERGHVSRDEAVTLLRPSSPLVDETVDLLARVAADEAPIAIEAGETGALTTSSSAARTTERLYIMTPVSDDEEQSAAEVIRDLLGRGIYFYGDRTPRRKDLKPGDCICFYQTQVGVVAEAEVASAAEERSVAGVRQSEKYPSVFDLRSPRFFFEHPIIIDAAMRAM